jgi:hypothetical protein
LRQFSRLHLGASEPDGVEAGDRRIPHQFFGYLLVLVYELNIIYVQLEESSEGNLFKSTPADGGELEDFDLQKLI